MPHFLALDIPNLLSPISGPMQQLLMLLTGALHSYGLAIIVFTILVRAILTPLNLRALRSQKRMATLGPKIKEIQQKYKGDREAITREQMALYKEEGINPAGGCLPLLIQMPILYSLFFVFQALARTKDAGATAIYHQHFLWFVLDTPDKLFGHFFLGGYWGPLALMAGLTQWVQSRMMMQPTSDPQQRSTQQIMQFLPLMIVVFAVRYPAGLALYWVVTTLYAIGLQYFTTGFGQLFKNPLKMPEPPDTAAPRPAAGARRQSLAAVSRATPVPTARATRNTAADAGGGTPGANGANGANGTNGTTTEDGARLGKMQRTVIRSSTKARSRSPKGAKR